MSTKYQNIYAQKVYEIILPLLGDVMAQTVLKTQTKKIAKSEELLTIADIPKLAEAIRMGLTIFLGSEGANNVAAKIAKIV
jgi:hypothetical protein